MKGYYTESKGNCLPFVNPLQDGNKWTGYVLVKENNIYHIVIYKFGVPLLKIPIKSKYECKTPWFYETTYIKLTSMTHDQIINIDYTALTPFLDRQYFELKFFKKSKPNGDRFMKFNIYEMPKKYDIFENRNSPFSFGFDLHGINI